MAEQNDSSSSVENIFSLNASIFSGKNKLRMPKIQYRFSQQLTIEQSTKKLAIHHAKL